jgi:DNA (cytosine-5)-methyltransferase 1
MGPILENGQPCPDRKGQTFNSFIKALKRQGYDVDWKELRACDYGAPTIRKRLFLVARRDGSSIVWPKPTHGKPDSPLVKSGKLKPWKTAAEIIDWSIPCPSIFARKKPLVTNTLKRIVKGFNRYVVNSDNPYIAPAEATVTPFITEHANGSNQRNMPINEPLRTITSQTKGGTFGLVSPILIGSGGPKYSAKPKPVNTPMNTIPATNHSAVVCSSFVKRDFGKSVGSVMNSPIGAITANGGGKASIVSASLIKHYGGVTGVRADTPMPTVTQVGTQNQLLTSHLIKMRNGNFGSPVSEPVPTITSGGLHIGEVRSFGVKYYGTSSAVSLDEPLHTVTTKDRVGITNTKFKPLPITEDQRYNAWWCARLMEEYGEQQYKPSSFYEERPLFIQVGDYILVDIGMRMFKPRELFDASSFPPDYKIDTDPEGKKISIAKQVARCGNAVPPAFAKALVEANLPEMCFNKFNQVA